MAERTFHNSIQNLAMGNKLEASPVSETGEIGCFLSVGLYRVEQNLRYVKGHAL